MSSAEVMTKHKEGNFETRGHLSKPQIVQSLEERQADAITLAASQQCSKQEPGALTLEDKMLERVYFMFIRKIFCSKMTPATAVFKCLTMLSIFILKIPRRGGEDPLCVSQEVNKRTERHFGRT